MAINEALENCVLTQLFLNITKAEFVRPQGSGLNISAGGDPEIGREIIRTNAETRVDLNHKVRIHYGNVIGYGYDFTKEHEGEPAREIYERGVKNTETMGGVPGFETLIAKGITDNFGWYMTILS